MVSNPPSRSFSSVSPFAVSSFRSFRLVFRSFFLVALPTMSAPAPVIDAATMQQQIQELHRLLQQSKAETQNLQAQWQNSQAMAAAAVAAVQGAPAPQSHRSQLKPPPCPYFKGEMGNSVEGWLRTLQQHFDFYGPDEFPTEERRIRYAALYFADNALTWWQNGPSQQGITEWDVFVNLLLERFRPFEAERMARIKLNSITQKGSVSNYSNYFLQLVASVPNMDEQDQIFLYIRGLKKPHTDGIAEE